MKTKLLMAVGVIFCLSATAQVDQNFNFGAGFGLNYGGIGVNIAIHPHHMVGITGHLGHNLVDVNAGVGLNLYLGSPEKVYQPVLKALYGYNASIIVLDYSEYNESYYGPSFGFGNSFRFGQSKRHGFDVDLLIPIRSSAFKDDFDELDEDSNIDITAPWPFTMSVGYHLYF